MLPAGRGLPLLVFCAAALSTVVEPLIIPQELPSILSLIYANIPPVKKGTDSRLGFGFRFGEHADFQVLIQLGPQTETQPIGPAPEGNGNANGNSKRQVVRQTLYTPTEEVITDSEGGKWLSSWRSGFLTKKTVNSDEIPTEKANISPDPTLGRNQVVTHLRKLYKPDSATVNITKSVNSTETN